MELRIGWLYGHEMNIYGDRGNVMSLAKRAEWRGIDALVQTIGMYEDLDPRNYDLYFWGGGQDREQVGVAADMQHGKGAVLAEAIRDGAPLLAICGGYQLLGKYYRPFDSENLPGINALDIWSEAGSTRFIGNVVADSSDFGQLVGFENHSALTFLGDDVEPLGTIRVGHGNNGQDGTEGARYLHTVGCYMHGALLPKNPDLADWLISTALQRRYGISDLPEIDDRLELKARRNVLARAVKLGR